MRSLESNVQILTRLGDIKLGLKGLYKPNHVTLYAKMKMPFLHPGKKCRFPDWKCV